MVKITMERAYETFLSLIFLVRVNEGIVLHFVS